MGSVKTVNRLIFLIAVVITGAIAGSFVWLLLYLMDLGLGFIWERVPVYLGKYYPIIVCIIGGVVIGLFTKYFGPYPENLKVVLRKVKRDGRYDYSGIVPMSVAALLPLIFGGSVGPEAGLAGVIAAVCTWVGERMRRFGSDFKELTAIGTYSTLSAIFTAPLYGFANAFDGSPITRGGDVKVSKVMKALVYGVAIFGALLSFRILSHHFGDGVGLPRYTDITFGLDEFIWLIPLALMGAAAGWLYFISDVFFDRLSRRFSNRCVLKATVTGVILGICGMILPFTMFSGEAQVEMLDDIWFTSSILFLLSTGVIKVLVTAMCVNMGWRGGHFFPLIFSGISIGYAMSFIFSIDPVFSICAVTAALIGGVVRNPIISVALLLLCFPIRGVLVLAIAAILGSYLPLPKVVERMERPAVFISPDETD